MIDLAVVLYGVELLNATEIVVAIEMHLDFLLNIRKICKLLYMLASKYVSVLTVV